MPHGSVLVSGKTKFILLIAVQKENGIIHGNSKLQHCRQSLGDVRYLPQKYVGSHVV